MKLIFLYGQSGTGKLTVGRELAKITDYKLFHNHLTIDPVHSLFSWRAPVFSSLVEKIRLHLITAAAKHNIPGIIFTFSYGTETGSHKTDNLFIKKIIKIIKQHKGEIIFTQLVCNKKEIYRRLKHPSRKGFSKIKNIRILKELERAVDFNTLMPFGETLIIDNTRLSPKQAAKKIKKYYKLR